MYPMILTIKEAVCKILAVILLLPTGYCLSDSNNTITAANPFESIENPYIVEYLNPDILQHIVRVPVMHLRIHLWHLKI